jgi:regulator of sirC expression with transglutaminase-like and TPR domain
MQVSQDFQNKVIKYVSIDNKIKQGQEAIRELKKEKEKTGKDLMIYIKTEKLEDCPINISNGKLKYAVSKTTVPMSKAYIEQRLEQYFKSKSKAKEVVEFLYKDRETNEKEIIRRINNRKKD